MDPDGDIEESDRKIHVLGVVSQSVMRLQERVNSREEAFTIMRVATLWFT